MGLSKEIVRNGKEFEETLKKWRKAKRHNDDRSTRRGLQSDLAEWKKEWKQCWKSQKRALTLDPDYGVIKLRYDMAKKSLKRALDRIETRKEERKRYARAKNNEENATEHNSASMNPSSDHESTSGESSEESGTDVEVRYDGGIRLRYREPEAGRARSKKRVRQISRQSTDYHSYVSTSDEDSEKENSRAEEYKIRSQHAR